MNLLKSITLTFSLVLSQTSAMELLTQPEQTKPEQTAQDPGILIQQAIQLIQEGESHVEDRELRGALVAQGRDLLEQAEKIVTSEFYLPLGDAFALSFQHSNWGYYYTKMIRYYVRAFESGQKKEVLEKLGREAPYCYEDRKKYPSCSDVVKGQ
jgi:hypothetical protein